MTPRTATLLLAAMLATSTAGAQDRPPAYPAKPIRLVVPFTPGGSSDILARAIGQKLTEASGQPVVIDNVPGAVGSLGAARVAKAAPDGYTLLMGHIGTLARRIGAINTIVVEKDGTLSGYNHDAFGFIQSLRDAQSGWHADAGLVTVLRAGGAARALVLSAWPNRAPGTSA